MPLGWIDVTELSFNSLLLLERAQLTWFPGWLPEPALGTALQANPVVEWYLRNKCPEICGWIDKVATQADLNPSAEQIRQAEMDVMNAINDLLVYVVDPTIYENLPFLGWDSGELTALVDFTNKIVIDVGAGTGGLAFVAAEEGAQAVYAVEPVGNLRHYLCNKARNKGLGNLFPVDGLITEIPFPDDFADVTMGGHVFGDHPEAEHRELTRVTKPGGMVVLCPGNNDRDEGWHQFLVDRGYLWSRFEEPGDGTKRKYWKTIPARVSFTLWECSAM